jgi:hypothetical protein
MTGIKTIQYSGGDRRISAQMCDNASFYSALIIFLFTEIVNFSELDSQSYISRNFLACHVQVQEKFKNNFKNVV